MGFAGLSPPYVLCALVEFLLLISSFTAALLLRLGWGEASPVDEALWVRALVAALIVQLCFYYGELYQNKGLRRRVELFVRITQCFAVGALALVSVFFAVPGLHIGRGVLALFLAISWSSILTWRQLFLWAFAQRALCDRVLVLGTGGTARDSAKEMIDRAPLGYSVLGFLTDHRSEVGRRLVNPSVLGLMDELPTLVRELHATMIVVAQEDRRTHMPVDALLKCRMEGIRIREAADVYEGMTGKILLNDLRPSWLIFSNGFVKPAIPLKTKRTGEALVAALLLVPLMPLLALIAIAIRLDSAGPILYRQTRVGERGRLFDLLKFRTMREDAETLSGPVWASRKSDPRVTAVGRWMRKTRLDELPQLLNVIRGEMSFVGPRPERPHFVDKLKQIIPYYDERHTVRPGITGWAQVQFAYGSTIEDAEEKLQYDLYYIKHMSLVLDTAIILETAKVALLGRGV
jgi:sugar transferase (PEP-CTERM system associated)